MPKIVLARDWDHHHAPDAHTWYRSAEVRPQGYAVSDAVAEAAAAAGVLLLKSVRARKAGEPETPPEA